MSGPLTNIDIEDVLASIRRLIVDGAEPPQAEEAPGRLVLTPAQRVTSEAASPRQPGAPLADPVRTEPSLVDRLREIEREVEAPPPPPPLLLLTPVEPVATPSADACPEPEPVPVAGPASAPDPGDDALRALIRDVLRQELEGDLGERITRNLRKLVRREVFRVLAAQPDR